MGQHRAHRCAWVLASPRFLGSPGSPLQHRETSSVSLLCPLSAPPRQLGTPPRAAKQPLSLAPGSSPLPLPPRVASQMRLTCNLSEALSRLQPLPCCYFSHVPLRSGRCPPPRGTGHPEHPSGHGGGSRPVDSAQQSPQPPGSAAPGAESQDASGRAWGERTVQPWRSGLWWARLPHSLRARTRVTLLRGISKGKRILTFLVRSWSWRWNHKASCGRRQSGLPPSRSREHGSLGLHLLGRVFEPGMQQLPHPGVGLGSPAAV